MVTGWPAHGQQQSGVATVKGREVTLLVTAVPKNDRDRAAVAKIQPDDFTVSENGQKQQVMTVKRGAEAPLSFAVVIQDDLVSRVSNEIQCIKDFMRHLPEGSRVMTAYISAGSLRVTQAFTSDRARAAESLRIVAGSTGVSPFSPYTQVSDALKLFDSEPAGRHVLLLVSDGLDLSTGFRNASPLFTPYLEQAVREAQRRGVAVFPFYAPSAGMTSWSRLAINYGQGSLNRLADETGGMAFFSGTDFVTFDPYFSELGEMLARQWVITFRSSTTGSEFRRIEVSTDYDVHLLHAPGYKPGR